MPLSIQQIQVCFQILNTISQSFYNFIRFIGILVINIVIMIMNNKKLLTH